VAGAAEAFWIKEADSEQVLVRTGARRLEGEPNAQRLRRLRQPEAVADEGAGVARRQPLAVIDK
jgi:hypothetical protein